MKLSVVVPTYNASEFIENTYADILFQLKKAHIDYEFLFRAAKPRRTTSSATAATAATPRRRRVGPVN